MGTRGESKISSSCFCVSCKSKELAGRGSARFPCVTPVKMLLRPSSSYNKSINFSQKSSTAVVRPDSECEVSK